MVWKTTSEKKIMSKTLQEVVVTAAALVSAQKAIEDNSKKLREFFPTLDDSAMEAMVKALAGVSVDVSGAPAPVVEKVESGSTDQKRTRPRQLMVVKPTGKEISVSAALSSILGSSQMRVPEICETFRKRGWKTNSHAGMKLEQSLYVALNSKKDLFEKVVDPTNRHNTAYKAVTVVAPVVEVKKPKVVKAEAKAKAVKAPAVKAVPPTVKVVEGKAPSVDVMLKVMVEKFVGKKFALREVAQELGVETRTISVNMRKLVTDNKVKKVGQAKVGDSGPAINFYELS